MKVELINIPSGCCEFVIANGEAKQNCFKIMRNLIKETKKGEMVKLFMSGTGFSYNGEIYHKSKDYAYIYLY